MRDCLDIILQIKSLCTEESELNEKRVKLETSLLEDTEYIPEIFEWFCEFSDDFQRGKPLSTRQKT